MKNYVQNVRVWRNMTQEELAKKAGVSKTTLRLIEVDNVVSKYTTMSKIAKALDYPIDRLWVKDDD